MAATGTDEEEHVQKLLQTTEKEGITMMGAIFVGFGVMYLPSLLMVTVRVCQSWLVNQYLH